MSMLDNPSCVEINLKAQPKSPLAPPEATSSQRVP